MKMILTKHVITVGLAVSIMGAGSVCTVQAQAQLDSSSVHESNYKAGMAAYMASDYERAQKQWIDAARDNHGRAMFNLGLLHEQGKIPKASLEKAFNWYRLAGRNGYAPANYHLGSRLLERSPNDQAGLELLNIAADQGYAPALQRLARKGVAKHSNSSIQASTTTQSSIAKQTNNAKPPVMKRKSYHDSSWIESRDSSSWTIQLLAFAEASKVRDFIDQHQLNDAAAYYLDTTSSPQLYKLVLGVYTDKNKAGLALKSLPPELMAYGPWLRSIASVQAVL